MDGLLDEYAQSFTYHYNFPPFAVGEVKPVRGPGRREIGHGALAERALEYVRPAEEDFAYTIRIVSDITESNGSSSMASVCGGSLALMDAGVPILGAVAGISVGLVTAEGGQYKLLTDIIGEEDHFGDMDFKIAGTTKGITAIQLDIKAMGLPHNIMVEALERARTARLQILEIMNKAISTPREELSKYAPKLITIEIDPEFIGKVIGPGGQDDQEPPGADGHHDRDRRGRHHLHQLRRWRWAPAGQGDDRGDDQAAGDRPAVQGVEGRLRQGFRLSSSRSCPASRGSATSASSAKATSSTSRRSARSAISSRSS